MSEDGTVYAALEQVTRTLNAMTTALEEVGTSITTHDRMFRNVEHNMGNFDDKARELQAKVYAQEQDIAELRREVEALKVALSGHSHPHSHSHLVGEP